MPIPTYHHSPSLPIEKKRFSRFAVAILGTRPGRQKPPIGEPKSDPLPEEEGGQLCFDGFRDHKPILSRDGFLLAPNFCSPMVSPTRKNKVQTYHPLVIIVAWLTLR